MTAEGKYLLGTRPRGVCSVIAGVARGRTVTELLPDYISPLLLLFHPTRLVMILWASALHVLDSLAYKSKDELPFEISRLHTTPSHYCNIVRAKNMLVCNIWEEMLGRSNGAVNVKLILLGLWARTRSTRCKMTRLVHRVDDERGAVL